jgi:peroxiredoxin
VAQLRHQYPDLQAAGAQVVVVGMGTPAQTRDYIAAEDVPFPVLSDPRRVSHRAYGAMRGGLRQLAFHPRIWTRGKQFRQEGLVQTETVGDPAQLSATFIIDRQGIIRVAERAALSSDFTSVDALLAALAALPRAAAGSSAA